MKNALLLLLLLSLSGCVVEQPRTFTYVPKIIDGKLEGILPVEDGKVFYSIKRDIKSSSAENIFRQARRWGSLRLERPSNILELSDNKTNDIIGTFSIPSIVLNEKEANRYNPPIRTPVIECALVIECNNNSYRITLGNFKKNTPDWGKLYSSHQYLEGTFFGPKIECVETLKHVERSVFDLVESLDRFIQRETK